MMLPDFVREQIRETEELRTARVLDSDEAAQRIFFPYMGEEEEVHRLSALDAQALTDKEYEG